MSNEAFLVCLEWRVQVGEQDTLLEYFYGDLKPVISIQFCDLVDTFSTIKIYGSKVLWERHDSRCTEYSYVWLSAHKLQLVFTDL